MKHFSAKMVYDSMVKVEYKVMISDAWKAIHQPVR